MPLYFRNVGTAWNNNTSWSTTSSTGASAGVIPSTTDDVIFDANSAATCPVSTTTGVCRDITTTGYTGTITLNVDIRVYRNSVIGATTLTGSGYLSMYSTSTPVTLNVAIGTTIPNLKSEPSIQSTITLTNTTVVTNYFKTEAASGMNVTFSAASAVELRVNNIVAHIRNTIMGTNTTMRFMGGTFVTCVLVGNYILNTGATLTGTGTNGAEFVFGGTTSFNISAGTLTLPAISNTYRLGTGIMLGQGTLTLNMGTNEIDYFYVSTAGPGGSFLVLQSDLIVNKGFHTNFYGARITPNGFNIITKESVAAVLIGFSTSAKISFKGVPSANGFLGMGYISGSTLTLTSVSSGSLAKGQLIHFPTVTGGAIYNIILSCTTFNSSYVLQFSQTVGSVGSPVPIYGYGGMVSSGGSEAGFLNYLFEVDAGSNDTYFLLGNLYTAAGEFRYLSTNTGAFDGSKATFSAGSNGANGIIDFQGQSSPTKFIGTLSLPNFFSVLTLKSNLYVNDHTGAGDSGILQSGGSYTLYVMRNFQANVSTAARAYQPTIELMSSTPANFTCGTLLGNVVINKSGGATVTVTQSFIYGYATPTTFTYTAGFVNFGATTMTIAGGCTIISPSSVGNFSFNNITVNAGITYSMQNTMRILGTLLCNGNAAFTGTHGWTTNVFTCSTANSTLTFQNINANPNAEYITTASLNIIGTSTQRITLQAAGSASYNGTITPVGQLNVTSGTAPTIGMTISQATNQSPAGLIGLLPNRPVVTGIISASTFTISPVATQVITSIFAMRAGFKAKFTLLNNGTATQNVAYATTQDIDSNNGQAILAFGSNGDDVSTNVSLFRTLNWGPLIAPSGSVYYTWVD